MTVSREAARAASEVRFFARWREELVGVSDEGRLVFELTMGTLHVYFPDEACWRARAPAWAREQWPRWLAACRAWCAAERIPLSLVADAHIGTE